MNDTVRSRVGDPRSATASGVYSAPLSAGMMLVALRGGEDDEDAVDTDPLIREVLVTTTEKTESVYYSL